MRSGQLRHPVTIQETSNTGDAYGSNEKVWVDFQKMRAAIWPQKSKEVVVGGKITAINNQTIRIRYIPGVTTAMRVKLGSRVFEILGIKNFEERNRFLDMTCREDV